MTVTAAVGLDIGTTSVKAVALADTGELVASASSRPLSLSAPTAGWALQSTAELHDALVECLASLVVALPDTVECTTLCAAVQSGSLMVVDETGQPGATMTTWMDTRTVDIVERWHADGTAARIRARSGWSAQPGLGLAQIVWLRENDPDRWNPPNRFGSADDFVVSRLTGRWATNPSNAAGMQLLDIDTGQWSPDLCAVAGISPDRLSPIVACGDGVGSLGPAMAARTGLPAGLAVISGGHDQTCTALALGVDEPGAALLSAGTAWVLTAVVDASDAGTRPDAMNLSFHVVDGRRTISRYLGGLGASMEWWIGEAGYGTDADRYGRLAAELDGVAIDDDSPFFVCTSDHDADASRPGAGRFAPSSPPPTGAVGARAIMELAAFEVRTSMALLPPGQRPRSLTLVGGATNAPGWPQMIADVCAVPVTAAPAHSWPALGAAQLTGAAAPLATGTESIAHPPRPDAVALFDRRYPAHLELISENHR